MGGIGSDTQEHTALVTARPSLIARVNCIKVMKYLLLQKEKPKGRPEVLTNRVLAKPRTLLPGGSDPQSGRARNRGEDKAHGAVCW